MVLVVEVLGPSEGRLAVAVVAVVEVGVAIPLIHISAKFLMSQVALTTTVYLREALLPS